MNVLSGKFGDESIIMLQSTKLKSCKSLKDIAFKVVSSGSVPKGVLACSVANIKYSLQLTKWEESSSIPLKMDIQHRNESFTFFSFPEYSTKCNQIEPRTLDPTHILTNLQAHAMKNGFDLFDKTVRG